MTEIPNHSFAEMLSSYDGRRPEKTQDNSAKPEILNIPNKAGLKEKAFSLARNAAKRFDKTTENDAGLESDYGEEGSIKRVPLVHEVLDATAPLSLIVFKSFNNLQGSQDNRPELNVAFIKTDISTVDLNSVTKGWFKENEIASVTYAHSGTEFELKDRFVPPKYRDQDFGSMIFNTSEEFIKQYAKDKQKECKITVNNAAQLQVMRWLWKHGFTPENEQKLADIFNGDERFILQSIENWDHVVLEKTDQGFTSGTMLFEKKYAPEVSEEIVEIADIVQKGSRMIT